MKVKTIVIRTAGSNCDYETVHAFEAVGSKVDLIHINRIIEGSVHLKDYQRHSLFRQEWLYPV